MRIALIHFFSANHTPIGMLSLATYIKKHGHEPIVLDIEKRTPPADFFEKTAKKILNFRPRAVGFSVTCSSLPIALLVARHCKKIEPQIPIILGGTEVSFEEIPLLGSFEQVDIIVRGEGEITLLELLDALEGKRPLTKILGITFKKNGTIVRNPDRPFIENLDNLPSPDFSLLPRQNKYKTAQIEGGRGCPNRCTFCSSCKMWKQRFRIKSPERLAQELKQTYIRFNKNASSEIHLLHDNLLTNRDWAEKFLSLISGHGLAWYCATRLDLLDEALIKKLKQAGCTSVYIGIESASPKIQRQIKKNLKLQKLPRILDAFSENNLHCSLSFVIGLPGEGAAELNQTLMLALKIKQYNSYTTIRLHLVNYSKGSELYNEMKKKLPSSRFLNTHFCPLLTGLPAERDLIKRHPQIFPSFYYIRSKAFDPDFLHKLSILFFLLCNFFPVTTILLLKSEALSPSQLGKKIIRFFDREAIEWQNFWDIRSGFFDLYVPFLKAFLESHSKGINNLIREMFINEESFLRVSLAKKFYSRIPSKTTLNSIPALQRGVEIKSYNYDLFAATEILRGNRSQSFPRKRSFVAYVPGNVPEALSLSLASYELLRLCDGKRSIREIIDLKTKEKCKGDNSAKSILKTFISLQGDGIIKV